MIVELQHLATCIEKRVAKVLAPLGITPWQLEVLDALQHAPRAGLQANQLIPAAFLSPAAMTNRLDHLQAAGWIVRLPHKTDRRASLIRLTPAGRAIAPRARTARTIAIDLALAPLSPAEREALSASVHKLLASLCESRCPVLASDSSTSND